MSSKIYTYNFFVAFADTDCGDVVYYARYLDHAERARTQLFVELGLAQTFLRNEHSLGFMVKSCHCEYRAPAKFEDTITINTRITPGKTKLDVEHTFTKNETVLFENSVTMVCINTDNFRPTRIPAFIAEKLC
ncbi:MAG: acyl-CoA thioesterase [Cellvibrionaceae bacterium]|nr:acyl-CoA thioesterase [Cellvibrionaceae bacterium]